MKGPEMYAIIFILIGAIGMLVYKDLKRDETRADLAIKLVSEVRTGLHKLNERMDANVSSMALAHSRYDAVLKLAEQVKKDCDMIDERSDEIDVLCRKLRSHMIKLQDKVSQKNINIQVIDKRKGEGVGALIK